MKLKRFFAALLAAVTLSGLLPPAGAADTAFRDVQDPELADQVEFLRVMEVVNGKGDGSVFDPGGTLTRAEFVKMAICAMGEAAKEPAQRTRTIYLDVGPACWARGYINLASSIRLGSGGSDKTGTPMVMGTGDGRFYPDRSITFGEAVTILARVLGYGAEDIPVGGAWYEGYLSVAGRIKLTRDLELAGNQVITRAQAAKLFYNLFFAEEKTTAKEYLLKTGGSRTENVVVLDTDATAADGTRGCLTVTSGTYKPGRFFSSDLRGRRGSLYLNKDEKVVAFREEEGSVIPLEVREAKSSKLIAASGEWEIDDDDLVYWKGKATTWSQVYSKVADSLPAMARLRFTSGGKLDYVYFPSLSTGERSTVMVARSVPRAGTNPFVSMTGGGSYFMVKNGLEATADHIRQYDVAVWDPAARTIRVCDLKLTGVYENAYPNPTDPTRATVMGHDFPVLPSARADLGSFRVGDQVTLLLTESNEIAGVIPADTVRSNAVGVATASDSQVSVTLLETGLTVSGTAYGSAKQYNNQLVTVTSSERGRLSLAPVSGGSSGEPLRVTADTLGDHAVVRNVKVFDRVEGSAAVRVDYADLPAYIPRSRIGCVLYDYADRVKLLVLNNATGDAYTYGYLAFTQGGEGAANQVAIRQADKDGKETLASQGTYAASVRDGDPAGLALDMGGMLSSVLYLQPLAGVTRAQVDYEEMTATVGGVLYPISQWVQVYNRSGSAWLTPGKQGVEAARIYADEMTLWFDRDPQEGGKIRLIEIR